MVYLLFRTRPIWLDGYGLVYRLLPRARRLGFRLYSPIVNYYAGVAPGRQYRNCYYAKYNSRFADRHPVYKRKINKRKKWGCGYGI